MKNDTVYFIEVKYRSSSLQGSGLDYITKKKQQQMSYAAETFIAAHNINIPYMTCAISVGPMFEVGSFIKLDSI